MLIEGMVIYFPDHALNAAINEMANSAKYKSQNKNPIPGINPRRKYTGNDTRKNTRIENPCHAWYMANGESFRTAITKKLINGTSDSKVAK